MRIGRDRADRNQLARRGQKHGKLIGAEVHRYDALGHIGNRRPCREGKGSGQGYQIRNAH